MSAHDTICAISTPPGVGGIAVLRLSGPDAKRLAEMTLRRESGRPVRLTDHKALFAHLYTDEGFLDEVVATLFESPHSYTGETVVEISCHGSLFVQQRMLQHFVSIGARLAEAGEYTLRAFLNRRLDLSQAEAVADLIDARSSTAHRLAVSQMRGGYARELEQLRARFVDLSALLELELDFSDEDVEFANRKVLRQTVEELKEKVSCLVESFQSGNALKNGVPVAIVGSPNVGKSTLLNALLHEDRAIVSDQAGTTRDTVEELFTINGVMFRLIDTAGIRHTDNCVEQAGIDRSRRAAEHAAIVLFVVDAADPAPTVAEALQQLQSSIPLADKHLLVVRNKCDLQQLPPSIPPSNKHPLPDKHSLPEPNNRDLQQPQLPAAPLSSPVENISPHLESSDDGEYPATPLSSPVVNISAKKGDGLDALRHFMVQAATQGISNDDVLLTNARHYEALKHVLSALDEVLKGMDMQMPSDLLVVDIRDALYHLGTITGKVASDEILSSVFSRFCIGK